MPSTFLAGAPAFSAQSASLALQVSISPLAVVSLLPVQQNLYFEHSFSFKSLFASWPTQLLGAFFHSLQLGALPVQLEPSTVTSTISSSRFAATSLGIHGSVPAWHPPLLASAFERSNLPILACSGSSPARAPT